MRLDKIAAIFILVSFCTAFANEVLDTREIPAPPSDGRVIVRENSKTGTAYVVITDPAKPRDDLARLNSNKYKRPDYRMLEKNVSAKDVGYDGPYSSKKKIYILAASLAVAGAGAAIAAPAIAPAAAGAGAAGSMAGPAIAAAGAGSALAVAAKKYQDHFENMPDDYRRASESKIIETETDFYKMHVQKINHKPFTDSGHA